MDSQEFALIAGQQLLQCDDLHYGYWDKNLNVTLSNLPIAQKKHTDLLLATIKQHLDDPSDLILDTGCGIGNVTRKILIEGLRVDGLVPSDWMAKRANSNVEHLCTETKGRIYNSTLQDFNTESLLEKYGLVFFSESYQYIELSCGFRKLNQLLKDKGKIVIFDFFRKDNIEGQSPLGGGHSMNEFYEQVKKNHFTILDDQDLTEFLSPNLALVHELLTQKIIPFSHTLDTFLRARYKVSYRILRFFLRKSIKKFSFKYSEQRNQENFEKHKSYRLIVLQKD